MAKKKKKSKARKPAKKKVVKARPKKAKPAAKRKAVKKKALKARKSPKKAPAEVIQGTLVGRVTHYFPHVKAGAILIDKGGISLGDTVHIKGHTTDFKQKIASLQIDRKPIEKALKGSEIGILVKSRVRIRDKVYKI